MVEVFFDDRFKAIFSKVKDQATRSRILAQVEKLRGHPQAGKPMRYKRKGTWELYIRPFRLVYVYMRDQDKVILLDLYHKKKQ